MNTAHQPGSEPVQIPEQIPNPAVRPPAPEPKPGRRAPVELPEKVPANRAFKSSLHTWKLPERLDRRSYIRRMPKDARSITPSEPVL